MATLYEYYLKDFSRLLSQQCDWTLNNTFKVVAKMHLDFDSNVFFISFFVPIVDNEVSVFSFLLTRLEEVFKFNEQVETWTSLPGEVETNSKDLRFSGKVFFYYEGDANQEQFNNLKMDARKSDIFIHLRDIHFAQERSKLEVPLAFISHDSRDKELIATPIANELQQRLLPIWYDEYSLKLGESLRESIEKGLKECKKCVLILSPNFLSNSGWTKTEFNTIFTREIIEAKNLVLPIWAGVNKNEIYEYCPTLVDRVGVNWETGIKNVVSKIQQVLVQE